jgi:type II secretion system protein N
MPVDLDLDRLKVTLTPTTLLYPFRKIISASFSAERRQDRFWGSLSFGRERSSVEFKTKNFKLDRSLPMDQFNPLLVGSTLTLAGNVTLSLALEGLTPSLQRSDLSAADGELNISGANFTIEAPIVKALSFEKITLDASLQKGNLNIKSIALTGPEVTIKASGSMKIEPFYIRSQLNLDAKITIDEKAKDLRSLFTLYATQQGFQTDANGTTAMKISGSLDRLTLRPF